MSNKENKFGFGGLFLLGVLVLLIAVLGIPAFVAGADVATEQIVRADVISVFDPFLLRKVTFSPKAVSISQARIARSPNASITAGNANGNSNGKPSVVIPGRRSVRSNWAPGRPPVNPPGLQD